MPLKLFSIIIGATFKIKNMPLRYGFRYVETKPTIQKMVFDDTDTNILRVCVHLLLIA